MKHPDVRLADLTRRQHGAFTMAQAQACGLHRDAVLRRAGRGLYVRLWRGVFADAAVPATREQRWMGGLLRIGGDAALSHVTAASLLGLEVDDPTAIHLLVANRTFAPIPGLVVHRSSSFTPGQVRRRGRLRYTDPARTLCDVAAQVSTEALRTLVAQAVRSGATTAERVRTTQRALGSTPGRAALRTVLDELSPLEAHTRSEAESRFLRITSAAGIPPTAMNHPVTDHQGRRRYLDAVYLPERVPVEIDSELAHGTRIDRNRDRQRENVVVLTGWRSFLRFTWYDLTQRPGGVVAELRDALAAARADLTPR